MLQHRKWVNVTGVGIAVFCMLGVIELISFRNAFAETTAALPIKTVAVVKVERANLQRSVSLTAELRSWQEIDIHAKVSGYLKTIAVDIGDQVKEGQVVATLDLPEEQQDQAKANADYQVAKLDYDRIQAVIKKQPHLLAQEEVDKAFSVYEEARAAYERTKILSDYAVITAPFDGVITKRFSDPGALVQAGTTSSTQPLVHLAEMDKLRLDFPVPESIVPQIKVGMPVDVSIQSTGKALHSSVARMSDKVDPATRTMDVEVDIDNKNLDLKPGMYATADLVMDNKDDVLAAPVQAVVTGKKPNVWVINEKNIIEERPVTIGIQTPDKIEIKSGVLQGDLLVYGNRSDFSPGTTVAPKLINATGG